MSYSILKQGTLTKKPIFFLICGFIAVTIFFTVLFSLKEQDKINEIKEKQMVRQSSHYRLISQRLTSLAFLKLKMKTYTKTWSAMLSKTVNKF